MKKRFIVLLLTATFAAAWTGIIVYAEQDGGTPHPHEYAVAAFDGENATVTCNICGEYKTVNFAAELNSTDCPELDMNDDGIVNAKDYAYLIKHFDENGPISSWESPEIGL
ncbi:MAG: hypothetical protein K6C14_06115 [Eubacterium sp.]|nr:hypothetical protein [Eubacterium sp.]